MSDSDFEYEELSESDSDISVISQDMSSNNSDDGDGFSARNWVDLDLESPSPPPLRFTFWGNPGCKFTITDVCDPLAYFLLFFDLQLINLIVTETNKFAMQQARSSRDQWEPVTVGEIYLFLAICILQGLLYKPSVKMYWSRNDLINTPIFGKLMTKSRYMDIKKNLHFADSTTYNPETHENPKLWKIWPVVKNLNLKFSSFYTPEQNVSVDESLLLFKGRLSWKQYIPLKRSRYGVKFFMLCESKSGYLCKFIIYTGKGTCLNQKYANLLFTFQVVLTLMDPLLDKGYCLTTDNYYTSPHLADYLITVKTDCCGTLRTTRKDVPKILHQKKFKKGETVAMQRGKVMIQKWHDRRTVTFLSTFHSPRMVSNETRTGKTVMKPQVVVDYNNTMGGVDLLDQHLHDYTVARKRGKKYYKKIFFQLLDISLYNSYVLYTKNGGEKTHLSFRMTIIERIITMYHTETRPSKHGQTRIPSPLRLTEKHFPDFIPPTDKKVAPTRYCVVCCSKRDDKEKKIRRETTYQCESCKVALCPAPCFKIYHTKINF
ncbi:piggyBac transposable element-derived protein 4-like [Centruroides sculpturatus]|uniref:piggyBac transposable element-derived protein 4-like n=1 Tax=Centruroides sculpturatus TaxID=218467 RepID=UPI000C6E4885|nr:piggyBac transposable element-derived protein 4-like [Centruroides sculpturatus]